MSVSAKREAKVELRSSYDDKGERDARRSLKQTEREQARARKQAERDAARARKQALGAGRSVLGTIKTGLGLGLGLDAAGGITGMVGEVLDYEKALTRLQITASTSPAVMRSFSKTVDEASLSTGIHRNEILSAAAAYVALTGDMDTARASTGTWAKIAQATGATVSDIAQTAAALSQQMGIGPAQMEATFSALAAQGKAGAIELKDLAGVMSQIAPMWAQFKNGRGLEGVRELGAALQVVKRGFGGDAGETVTGLQGLLVALTKNAGRFRQAGIKIFDVDRHGKESMRDVFSIVDAISHSSLVQHPDLLEKAFGRVEAYRAYLQLSQNKELLDKFVREASDTGLIGRDFATYMESSSAKMERSWNEIKLAVISAFTPERIQAFADGLSAAADKIMEVARWIDEHSDIEKNPNLGHEDADRVVQQLEDQPISLDRMREIAVRLQNLDPNTGGNLRDLPEVPQLNTTYAGMIEAGERLGRKYHAISAGMMVHVSQRRQFAEEWFPAALGIRAPWLGADPWAPGAPRSPSDRLDARQLADAIAGALQRAGIQIKVGSEPLVKATRNAATLNTRPGGRQ